jgi:hypothetical protein
MPVRPRAITLTASFRLVKRRRRCDVHGVPKTIVNETVQFVGALPEPSFLENVLKAVAPASRYPAANLLTFRQLVI